MSVFFLAIDGLVFSLSPPPRGAYSGSHFVIYDIPREWSSPRIAGSLSMHSRLHLWDVNLLLTIIFVSLPILFFVRVLRVLGGKNEKSCSGV